jgi:hypothetical protein
MQRSPCFLANENVPELKKLNSEIRIGFNAKTLWKIDRLFKMATQHFIDTAVISVPNRQVSMAK